MTDPLPASVLHAMPANSGISATPTASHTPIPPPSPLQVGRPQTSQDNVLAEVFASPARPLYSTAANQAWYSSWAGSEGRIVCYDVLSDSFVGPSDRHAVLGTAAGAALGAAVGYGFFGRGLGKAAVTVAGAGLGGWLGHHVEQAISRGHFVPTQQQRCRLLRRP